MCGRARCTLRPDAVLAACGITATARTVDADRCRLSYNVCPGAYMPVLRYESNEGAAEPVVQAMRWGLVPSFTKTSEKPDFFRMFNARSESVSQKASFRRLLPRRRCVVAVEGFYEWKKDGTKKQPYYVHLKDGRPLIFAGLYDTWTDAEGNVMHSFTILTTGCSKALEWLHDRMPVILANQDAVQSWLEGELLESDLKRLTQPYGGLDLVWIPVTPEMGKPSFNGPECVEEVKSTARANRDISQMFDTKKASRALEVETSPMQGKSASEGLELVPREFEFAEEEKAILAAIESDQDVTEAPSTEAQMNLDEKESKDSGPLTPSKPKSVMRPTQDSAKTHSTQDSAKTHSTGNRRTTQKQSPSSKKPKLSLKDEKQKSLLSFFGKP